MTNMLDKLEEAVVFAALNLSYHRIGYPPARQIAEDISQKNARINFQAALNVVHGKAVSSDVRSEIAKSVLVILIENRTAVLDVIRELAPQSNSILEYIFDRYQNISPKIPILSLGSVERNPAVNPDLFDLLRALNETMQSLSREIRKINDLDRMSPEIIAVRAYLDASRSYMDDTFGPPASEIPSAVPRGLMSILKKVNWLEFSENAQKWADTLNRLLSEIFR